MWCLSGIGRGGDRGAAVTEGQTHFLQSAASYCINILLMLCGIQFNSGKDEQEVHWSQFLHHIRHYLFKDVWLILSL